MDEPSRINKILMMDFLKLAVRLIHYHVLISPGIRFVQASWK